MHIPRVSRRASQAVALLALFSLFLVGPWGCQNREPRSSSAAQISRQADQLRLDVRAMFGAARERVFPALVNIQVVTVNYAGGKERKGSSVGSGTIISAEGHVVTNQHVTSDGKKFKCTLTDQREVSADLVGEDPLTDLAVLKLHLGELGDDHTLPVAEFGDSGRLLVGDYVMAMGSPFSLSRSVTLGIVSNTERVFGGEFGGDEVEEMELDEGQRTGLFTNWIQHDAPINPGNSGGPLVNLKGEVVGVNELGGDGMGFAIPSNLVRAVVAELITHGQVTRSTIGASFKAIQRTGLTEGVLVNSVDEEGPAGRAGLKAGDVVVKLNDEPLTVRFLEQVPPLLRRIADLPVGAQLRVTYRRDGQSGEITITTERLRRDRGDEAAFRAWGLTGMQITEKLARDQRLSGTAGVIVSSIRSGGPAATAEPPLNWGDVIRGIDRQPVRNLRDLIECYREIMDRAPLPDYVLVEFDRRGQDQVTLIKPAPEKEENPPREVRKAWIGVATQPVLTQLAAKLGFENHSGFRVTRVYPGTEAAKSELKVGDVIIKLNGEELTLRGLQDAGLLARQVRRLDIGASATLTVLRDGTQQELRVALEPTRLTPEEARRDRNPDFELTVRELTFFDRDANRWDERVHGVLVEQVEEAGWAGLGGLQAGDLIQELHGKPVRSLAVYRRLMDDIEEAEPERVVFVVLRGVRTHFQYVEPDWNPVTRGRDTDEEE